MLKYEYTVVKSKNQRRAMLLQSIYFCLVASDGLDRIDTFNANSRKSVPKLSGLRWFLLFEDLYNEEGSLQANKTSEKR